MNLDELQLQLNSPVGGKPVIYRWPLLVGVGDERDECSEIIETIRWVFADNVELKKNHKKLDFLTSYDPKNYQSIKSICEEYNRALDESSLVNKKSFNRHLPIASPNLLKHIMQVAYNRSIEDPDKLNQYEPFSPEVYGETSFELIRELTQVIHVSSEDTFIDLGSGVGQVVLQIAASTRCKFSYGIEKAHWPAKYSKGLAKEFGRWMSFFGKHVSPFELEKGDFLGDDKVDVINSASIIFVNNFAFGPNVDHQLKLRFANVKEGARIISSKAFCSLNFHITERNLSDIGTIMKVEELTALPSAVSWTDKPFSYYLHTIDRSLLETYFKSIKSGGGKKISTSSRVCKRVSQLKSKTLRKSTSMQKKHSEEEEEEEEEDDEEVDVSVKKKIAPKTKRKLSRRLVTPLVRRGLYRNHRSFKNNKSLVRDDNKLPGHIRKGLNNYLANIEEGMLHLMTYMHTQQYKQYLSQQIQLQKRRQEDLKEKEEMLKKEVLRALTHGISLMHPYFKQNGNDLVGKVWSCLERRKELMSQQDELSKLLSTLNKQAMANQPHKDHSLTLQELLSLNEQVKYNLDNVQVVTDHNRNNIYQNNINFGVMVSKGLKRQEKKTRGGLKQLEAQASEEVSRVKRSQKDNANIVVAKKFKKNDSSVIQVGASLLVSTTKMQTSFHTSTTTSEMQDVSNESFFPPINYKPNEKLLYSKSSTKLITTSSVEKNKVSSSKSSNTFQVTSSPSPFHPSFFNKTTPIAAPSNIFKPSTTFASFPFYKPTTSLSLSSTFFSKTPMPSAILSKPLFTDLASCNLPSSTQAPFSKCVVMFSSPLLSPPLLSSVLSTVSSSNLSTTPTSSLIQSSHFLSTQTVSQNHLITNALKDANSWTRNVDVTTQLAAQHKPQADEVKQDQSCELQATKISTSLPETSQVKNSAAETNCTMVTSIVPQNNTLAFSAI